MEDLQQFMNQINSRYGIKLTSKWSVEEIQYLDLEIFKSGNRLLTRIFFLRMLIRMVISQHGAAIKAIPKG